MEIRKKIILSIIFLNIILIIGGYFISVSTIGSEISSQYEEIVDKKAEILESIMEDKMVNVKNMVDWFENSGRLIKSLKANNRDDVIDFGKIAMKDFNLDYWLVTDTQGIVIARAHKPESFGDSIVDQVNIQKALSGEKSVGIETEKNVGLFIRAGCPVIDENGNIIGVVSMGYTMSTDLFADDMSGILNSDVTLFDGIQRVGTTLKDGDKRLTGTKLENKEVEQTVLIEGKKTSGINKILGKSYYSVYMPIADANNEIIGMYFVGEPISIIKKLVNGLTIFQIITTIMAMSISIFVLSLILRKNLSRPLNKLGNYFKELTAGEGDLTQTMDISTKDEVGKVVEEFNKFILKLRGIILQVKESSAIVVTQTTELIQSISISSESMVHISDIVGSISADLQASAKAVGQAAFSTQEMYTVSDTVANSCIHVSEQSLGAHELVIEGSQNVKEVIHSIEDITNSSQEVIQKMKLLQQLSTTINQVITIITGISSQTKLLALNASIEAARAGEQGRGFAVVAEEVGKLAAKSAESSSKITNLIHVIQNNIEEAFLKVEQVSQNVDEGVIKASKVSQSFEEISKAINVVSGETHDIAAATEQQSAAISEISGSMDMLEKGIKNISENSQKMDSSIHQENQNIKSIELFTLNISKTVKQLNIMVEKFKV